MEINMKFKRSSSVPSNKALQRVGLPVKRVVMHKGINEGWYAV
jgi:hypothetical protein